MEMGADQVIKIAETAARVTHLAAQLDAELRVAAWPLQEKHHSTGYIQRGQMVQIVLDHRQRHVNPRRDPGRCPDMARGDKNRVGLDGDSRILAPELPAIGPVRCRFAAIENSKRGENECPGADGPESAWVIQIFDQLGLQRYGRDRPNRLISARNEQRVNGAKNCSIEAYRFHIHARVGHNRATPLRGQRDLISGTAISEASVAESLQRPGYVHQVGILVSADHNLARYEPERFGSF